MQMNQAFAKDLSLSGPAPENSTQSITDLEIVLGCWTELEKLYKAEQNAVKAPKLFTCRTLCT